MTVFKLNFMQTLESSQIAENYKLKRPVPTLEIEHSEGYRPHFGNNCFLVYRNYQPTITIGPHWPLSLCLQMGIIAATLLIESVIYQKHIGFRIACLLSGIFMMAAHLSVVLKNPGVNFSLFPCTPNEKQCLVCKLPKLPGTVHCLECDICIRGHDHHCPWVGKCVGEGNVVQFQIFLMSFVQFFIVNLVNIMV